MKKYIILITLILTQNLILAQNEINFGNFSKPVPSVSSLSTYTNTPVSFASGIPEISFPLMQLPTHNKGINLGVTLAYHPLNISQEEPASEVGAGWSTFSGGCISREIILEPDEKYNNASAPTYKKNEFDDIYYYNIPGISGKFKILRDIANNTFSIVNLTANDVKIEYTRENNDATLVITSFTITDNLGNKYLFNDYSQSRFNDSLFLGTLYKSAFFLSQILDPNNIELAAFTYQKDNKYKNNSNFLMYQSCKIKDIESKDYGMISIDYSYEDAMENTMNDTYRIDRISLKNKNGTLIYHYGFDYSSYIYSYGETIDTRNYSKRILKKLNKLDQNQNILETTKFEYSSGDNNYYGAYPSGILYGDNICQDYRRNPSSFAAGSLKRVILPTKGVIEYNFEVNQYYENKNDPKYIDINLNEGSLSDPEVQYIQTNPEIPFNTKNTTEYTFQVNGIPGKAKKIYFQFYVLEKFPPKFGGGVIIGIDPETQLPIYDLKVGYMVKQGSKEYSGGTCGGITPDTYSLKTYNLIPGTYTIKITGTGGMGLIVPHEVKNMPLPYKNIVSRGQKYGVRIGNIKYYDSENLGSLPQKTIQYEYNDFNDPKSSSGYIISGENISGNSSVDSFILYKNVKVSEGTDSGYTKYYFKTPNDYPKTPNDGTSIFWSYYSVTKNGILEKKEIYNSQNTIVSSDSYDYTFENLVNAPDYLLFGNTYTKTSWIKDVKILSKSILNNGQDILEKKTETYHNASNFKISSVKETASDGTVSEKNYKYALETANQKLITANMTGIDLQTEIRSNGKLISNTQIKYENSGNIFPSSLVSVNPNDGSSKTTIKYDEYDSKGNILQFTSNYDTATGAGVPTAIIWGYGQTQPIAKIEGLKLTDIGNLADDIILKSNNDIDDPSEAALINALDSFRNLPALRNAAVTTYTYNPLIGITTITPPNGMRQVYKYDKNGRLVAIADVNGNILKDYKYNTKPQQY